MATWAVIKTGGKQFKVAEGDSIDIEKVLPDKTGAVIFDQVLLINNEGKLILGKPFVEKANVKAKLINEFKERKIRVIKFKPKSRYLRTSGHRQTKTRILIEKIKP